MILAWAVLLQFDLILVVVVFVVVLVGLLVLLRLAVYQ